MTVRFSPILASSVLVSIFTIGGMLGGLLSGAAADFFGRKWALLYNNGIGLVACVLMFSAKYLEGLGMGAFYLFAVRIWGMEVPKSNFRLQLGRFIVGINAGANSGLVPIYLMEIAPIDLRGSISSANQSEPFLLQSIWSY
jgi:MFS family permease